MSYLKLHDGLSEMIESGRLIEADIPDDYQWLVESLAKMSSENGRMIPYLPLYKRLIQFAGKAEERHGRAKGVEERAKSDGQYLAFVRAAAIVKEMMEES